MAEPASLSIMAAGKFLNLAFEFGLGFFNFIDRTADMTLLLSQ